MADLQDFIAEHVPKINQQLKTYLKPLLPDERRTLEDAMGYSFAGGKRLRPLLAIASYSLFDQASTKILPFCCAIEIFHTYTLIHDDLPALDNDDYRRGQITNHKKFSEDMAILAGDALHAYAFEILAKELPRTFSVETTIAIIARLAHSLGREGMVGGQALDMSQNIQTSALPEAAEYLNKIHALKTGTFIAASLVLPLVLLGRTTEEVSAMEHFSYQLGLLFQITDDILDVTGTQASLGKTINKDAAQNKLTYVSLFGLSKAQRMADEVAHQAKVNLAFFKHQSFDIDLLAGFVDYILARRS